MEGEISMTPETHTPLRPVHLLFRVIRMESKCQGKEGRKEGRKCDPVPTEHLNLRSEAVGYCSQGKGVGHEGCVSVSNKTIKGIDLEIVIM